MLAESLFPAALEDRYEMPRLLGRGAMGLVFAAKDRELRREVAVKVLSPELAGAIDRDRFIRESRTLAALSHPGVVRLFDAGLSGPELYLVMALLRGQTLQERLEAGTMGEAETTGMLAGALEALQHVHENGVLHRDLKPSNLFLQREGGPVLLDFGLARGQDCRQRTQSGLVMGSLHSLAPELLTGAEPSAQSDLFGLALCALEALTGVDIHANPGDRKVSPEQIMSSLGSGTYRVAAARALELHGKLGQLLLRTLSPDPSSRPAAAAERAGELARLAPGQDGRDASPTALASLGLARLASVPAPALAAPAPRGALVRPAGTDASGRPSPQAPAARRWRWTSLAGAAGLGSSLALAVLATAVEVRPPAAPPGAATGPGRVPSAGPGRPATGTGAPGEAAVTCEQMVMRLQGLARPSELRAHAIDLTGSLMFESHNARTAAAARSHLSTSGIDVLGTVAVPFFARPASGSDEVAYGHLFWRHALARLASPERADSLVPRTLFPEWCRPGTMPPEDGRRFSLALPRDLTLGVGRRVRRLGFEELAMPLVDRYVGVLQLTRLEQARRAWVLLRSTGAQWPEVLRVSINGRCTVYPVVSPENRKCFAHSIPPWALRNGENRLEAGVEALMGSSLALRGMRALEVVLWP